MLPSSLHGPKNPSVQISAIKSKTPEKPQSFGAFAVQRATLQPSTQTCSSGSSMLCCGLCNGETEAYFTGGVIPGIPDYQERWVKGEKRGGGEGGRRESAYSPIWQKKESKSCFIGHHRDIFSGVASFSRRFNRIKLKVQHLQHKKKFCFVLLYLIKLFAASVHQVRYFMNKTKWVSQSDMVVDGSL